MKISSPLSFRSVSLPTFLFITASAGLATVANLSGATSYHVRPYTLILPAAVSDGLIENGATFNSLSFSDASKTARASANLETGELKAYAGITNSIAGALALAEYSDTSSSGAEREPPLISISVSTAPSPQTHCP